MKSIIGIIRQIDEARKARFIFTGCGGETQLSGVSNGQALLALQFRPVKLLLNTPYVRPHAATQ